MTATDVGTLFLDQKLRIRMFTPRVAGTFNIAAADIGRAITDFTHRLDYPDLSGDAARVLHELVPIEREVGSQDGRTVIVRLRPYRTIDDRISGIVVTIIDVTERRAAIRALGESEARLRALVSATSDVVYRMGPDWHDVTTLHNRGVLPQSAEAGASWLDIYVPTEAREAVGAEVRRAIDTSAPFEMEHRALRADGTTGWSLSRAVPITDGAGRVVEWFGASADVTDRYRTIEELRSARDALALATSASELGWGSWDLAADCAHWDARGREIIGLDADNSSVSAWTRRIHPDDRARVDAALRASLDDRRPFELDYRVVRPDGSSRVVHGTGTHRTDVDGPTGTGLVRDVTEARRWQDHQRLMIGELNHRVKNMLAVVQSIAGQTRRDSTGVDDFFDSFGLRIEALARTHAILTRASWIGADLRELVDGMLSALADGVANRVDVSGPPIRLVPNGAISFSMALHELGTNAIKHGSWSAQSGRVTIRWWREEDGVRFDWIETGGPPAHPPECVGFGARLLTEGVPWELRGTAELDYTPEGLSYRLEFPETALPEET